MGHIKCWSMPPKKNIFDFAVFQVIMTAFGYPFGLTNPYPFGSLVTCSFKAILLRKGRQPKMKNYI